MMETRLGGLTLRSPFLGASGCFGNGYELSDIIDLSAIGGFVTKSVTVSPRAGNPMPRIWETPSGMLNAIGLENAGLDHFVETSVPKLASIDAVKLVNVAGFSIEDYVRVIERLDPFSAIDGFEINISCPNVGAGCISIGTVPEQVEKLMASVRPRTAKHLMVKLTPNVTSVESIARAAEAGGADSVSLINTLTGMAIDPETRRFRIANKTGGLSGPAIRPVAVRMVYQVAKAVKIPVVGLGGIDGIDTALEFILAGATAVQVGTYHFINPRILETLPVQLAAYLERKKIKHYSELIGSATD